MDLHILGNRIIWARTQKGWSSADLIRESGVPQGTVSKMENLKQDTLGKYGLKLQRALGVRFEWLAQGEGDPYEKNTAYPPTEKNLSDRMNSPAKEAGRNEGHVYVQSYELWRGEVEAEIRFMTVPVDWLETEGLIVDQIKTIEMPDNSQADRIRKGDIVAVNVVWDGNVKNDTMYAIRIGGQHTLRRTAFQANGNLILRCRNDEEYPDETVSRYEISELDILGEFLRFQGSSS